ncbi:unnamed protein product [Nesidiocoris tenuis]|uniref:Uncharacterized protein n=1 Tax=Nesidiocoris tenuis TaxID=355587 RepID=A0A6H5GCW2_9HEMI|nr:unnamed protein product [Nesidiocoris tenuis]
MQLYYLQFNYQPQEAPELPDGYPWAHFFRLSNGIDLGLRWKQLEKFCYSRNRTSRTISKKALFIPLSAEADSSNTRWGLSLDLKSAGDLEAYPK